MQHTYKCIGAAVGKCAGITGCEQAPDVIRSRLSYLENSWHTTLYCQAEETQLESIAALADFSHHLAVATHRILQKGSKFITFGGDHSSAIGTWSGVANHFDEFGLIWIDAHMDAHTNETSPSGNPHGMPVAALLGHGDERLTSILNSNPKIKPHNITLIGIRSYEPEEKALLDKLGVKVYLMESVLQKGFAACLRETIADFHRRGLHYGMSLDLDGLDPRDISSLGTPVEQGIRLSHLLNTLHYIDFNRFIGLEITEYNPTLDTADHADIHAIDSVLRQVFALSQPSEIEEPDVVAV